MNNNEILAEMDRVVVGHTEVKKALIALVTRSRLRHFQKYIKLMDESFLLTPMKLLMIGASGSGKTLMLETLRKIVHFPLVRIDATQLNPSGAGGGIKQEGLIEMIKKEAEQALMLFPHKYFSLEGAIDKTVVFIDEVDKLGNPFESTSNWNRHVQSNFLVLFDNKAELAGVSYVFAGAFTNLTSLKEKAKDIGFYKHKEEAQEPMLDDAIVKSGLIPEFVGRLNCIAELDKFDKETYLRILKEKILPKKMLDLAAFGAACANIEDEVLEELAERAHKSNQGVRYLNREIDKRFLSVEFEAGVTYSTYNTDH